MGRQWEWIERTRGSGYSGATWRRGKGGPGVGGTWLGGRRGRPDNGRHGRLPATWNRGREGERVSDGVAGMCAGSGVWGPAAGREREQVREGDRWGRLQCRWFR
jgi:hypothetical protein